MAPPTLLQSPIPFDPSNSLTSSSLQTAAAHLSANNLVAFPTETVYGLGASALSSEATAKIFKAKGRPSDNPLIVHVSDLEMLYDLIPGGQNGVPEIYKPLMKKFWPGSLSLIFPLVVNGLEPPKKKVVREVTAGLDSIAIRMPSHPLALALIAKCGLPLAAPSANLSSRPSPTTAQHCLQDFAQGDRGVEAILDGGDCSVGVESTVVDIAPSSSTAEGQEIRILRAGGVGLEDLEACLKDAGFGTTGKAGKIQVWKKDFESAELDLKPTTPGMKYKHYSPKNSRVVIVSPHATVTDSNEGLPTFFDLLFGITITSSVKSSLPLKVGLMLSTETLSQLFPASSPSSSSLSLPSTSSSHPFPSNLVLLSSPLGSQSSPIEAAQNLFKGLRHFDEQGDVEVILVESVSEKGVGLAVMERMRKSAGGGDGGELKFRL